MRAVRSGFAAAGARASAARVAGVGHWVFLGSLMAMLTSLDTTAE